MVEAFGKSGGPRAYHVARACTLAPNSAVDMALVSRLSKRELNDSGTSFWSLNEQGALCCRTKRYKDAVPLLEESLKVEKNPGNSVLNWLWLALAHHHLGESDKAQAWRNKAVTWLNSVGTEMPLNANDLGLHLHNWLEAHILLREVNSLLTMKP